MKTYQYTGDQEVHVNGVGIVKPGQVVKTEIEINHPLFVEVKEKTKGKDK